MTNSKPTNQKEKKIKITQANINNGKISKFSQINRLLNEDNCFFEGDYSESYLVKANVSREEAYWAMRLIDFKDAGITDKDDGVQIEWLKQVNFYKGRNEETDEDDWWWTKPAKNRKFVTEGYQASI